jgi:hypothetical protein
MFVWYVKHSVQNQPVEWELRSLIANSSHRRPDVVVVELRRKRRERKMLLGFWEYAIANQVFVTERSDYTEPKQSMSAAV